jgi:iron only hydrogenase large subunit-like protein
MPVGGGGVAPRIATLREMDGKYNLKISHDNPTVKRIYKDFLGEPNKGLARACFHTAYLDRSRKTKKGEQ